MSAKKDEIKNVYWVRIHEVMPNGTRPTIAKEVYEGVGSAMKKYNDWIAEYESVKDKKLVVTITFIFQNAFYSVKEFHIWDNYECVVRDDLMKVERN